jgi:hypothetical protein
MTEHEGQFWFLKGYHTGRIPIPPIKDKGYFFAWHEIEHAPTNGDILVQFCNSGAALLISRKDARQEVMLKWRVKLW